MGNTQMVAMRHDVDVTDADFERATTGDGVAEQAPTEAEEKAAHNAAQSAYVLKRDESQALDGDVAIPRESPSLATCGETMPNRGMDRMGLEPTTSALRTRRSPN